MTRVVNDLLNFKNIKIIQNKDMFNFSLDSALLAGFITLKKDYKKILDIGAGNAPIPLILSTKTGALIDCVEIQKESFEIAKENISNNKLSDKISVYNCDISDFSDKCCSDTYDAIVCNPPFFDTRKDGNFNNNESKTIARHEGNLTLETIFKVSKKLLKNKGRLAIVHRSNRLIDIVELMRENNIEPKRIMFVYPKQGKESNIVLIEGSKNGGKGLKILDPLIVHNSDGSYTEEVRKYFG